MPKTKSKSVCTAKPQPPTYKSVAMNAAVSFAILAIGVTSFKRITKYGCAIDAMDFTARSVTKWINAMIVEKSYVPVVALFSAASFVGADFVKTARRRVDGT